MTSNQDTTVACWRVSTWASVFGCLQIVGSISGVFGAARFGGVDKTQVGLPMNEEVLTFLKDHEMVLLVLSIIHLNFAVLLLVGNKMEALCPLWSWIVHTGMDLGALIIFGIVVFATITHSPFAFVILWYIIIGSVFNAFMISVVCRRIKDIKTSYSEVTNSEC